ncbi:hypothetical protein L249_3569 [Ophiocordyceps polyrhachis-furcata BCC 54312]|uniref:phosphomannomutase n=1 Tax=Ophiocordyceps polyrhachis-furcata BCC 54312 TaxID=1330021 RepID=A0A367LM35_9HYPO|nr:hypothetical protein L249_3569 [Ophiocordyceps polyrhachis-furcata BCC 54312]
MRSSLSSRPFLASVAILSILTAYSFFLASQRPASHHGTSFRRDDDVQCRHLDAVADPCAFVKRHCADVDAGLVPYLELYYCTHKGARPLAFSLLVAWLALLFTTIGIAASDFFCVNLATISSVLGLSQSLAGVTFLALGNGSPDVFSTFAAMSSNSPAMAIGELIGAASFIAGVVAGSMALVREFRVDRESYARDICFFIVAVAFTMAFLADGRLHLWECCVMIGYYVVYVVTVVACHWYGVRKKRRLRRDGEARSHVYAMPGHAGEELAGEPYRDDPEAHEMPRSAVTRADDHHEMMLIAEVTSNMRVVRVGRRRPTCATPIRPSLVGALEFRSALSQLQRESNLQLSPLLIRGQYENHIRGRARRGTTCNALYARSDDGFHASDPATTVHRRDRALSSGDIPTASAAVPDFLAAPRAMPPTPQFLSPETERTSPLLSPTRYMTEAEPPERPTRETMPKLRLQIPDEDRNLSAASSPQSTFPRYTDPLAVLTPNPLSERRDGLQQSPAGPVRRWPHWALPPPDVLLATLFPTLQDWREKSYWDRFLSAVSVPSIFLLVITLPVVDTEPTEDTVFAPDAEPSSSGYGTVQASAPAISVIPADEQPEEGCNEYVPPFLGAGPDAATSADATDAAVSAKAPSEVRSANNVGNEPPLWNRWLVCLQLFSGPLFSTLILWFNLREEMAQPTRELLRMMAFSLLLSVLLLSVVLLTTTKQRRPRFHYLLCFLGFVISVAWISTIAGEVVGVLKAFGVILDISEALLGLTVFAAGNSIGDLVADITVARLGYPVMALSACFGGPMLNILLGIGIGGVMMMIKQANSEHAKHPDRPMRYGPYRLQLGGTLLVSGVTLLLILVVLVVLVPMNRWILSRKIGWLVMTLWILSTVVSVVIELTGVWSEERHSLPHRNNPPSMDMDASIPPLASRPLPDTICLFDVDGTLTPARLDASAEMLTLLRRLRQRCAIGFVGGSDLAKQEEQLGRPAGAAVTSLFDFCFSENGLTAFKMGQQLDSNSFIRWLGEDKYRSLVDFVLRYVADLDIPVKRGTFVEFRNGMVNISPVGRNASTQERLDFEAYDKVARVREKFVAALRERFAEYGLIFAIGGQISFDVFPQGWDKTYCLRHLRNEAEKAGGVTYKKIHFFGDKTFQGGNDWEIYNHPDVTGHSVKGPEDTMRLLKELFDL